MVLIDSVPWLMVIAAFSVSLMISTSLFVSSPEKRQGGDKPNVRRVRITSLAKIQRASWAQYHSLASK